MKRTKAVLSSPAFKSQFTFNGEVFKFVRRQGAYTVALRDNGCLTSLYLPKDFFSVTKRLKNKRGS